MKWTSLLPFLPLILGQKNDKSEWPLKKNDKFDSNFGIKIGRLVSFAHGIYGIVYAVDERHLFIRNFRYDATGPDAYFWVGDDKQPSPRGQIVSYPSLEEEYENPNVFYPGNNFGGKFDDKIRGGHFTTSLNKNIPTLKRMRNKNILLKLPGKTTIRMIRWLSIWCSRFTVNYGFVSIPENLIIPKPEIINAFPNFSEKLSSGRITILDSENFYIPNLQLNVEESGFHFWVGSSSSLPNSEGQAIPNEKATFNDLMTYRGNDIILSLPNPLTMYDINYLAIYNSKTSIHLGHVSFNASNYMLPPALGQTKKPGWWFDVPITITETTMASSFQYETKEDDSNVSYNPSLVLPNCRELLGRKIRLLWKNEGGKIYFRLKVHMNKSQFAALGITPKTTKMIDADIVKIFYNSSSNRFEAIDAFMSKRLNCGFEEGFCNDLSFESGNDVRFMGSLKNTGLSIVDFRRSILPKDAHDAPIAMDEPTQIIVAIGSKFPGNENVFQSKLHLETENTTINFSSDVPEMNCPEISSYPSKNYEEVKPEESWRKSIIRGRDLFVARLGPPGGNKGYGSITGIPPADINVVWYINGLLLPELYVERGKTYSFRIQGGDTPGSFSSYHPLYITSDSQGGYMLKPQYERSQETVYAGVDYSKIEAMPTGIGPLCEFVSDGTDKTKESLSFKDFKASLRLACTEGREGEYGWVNWTVSESSPNLLYYQSFAEYGMGWKIHVLDEGQIPDISASHIVSSTYKISLYFTLYSLINQ